MPRELIRRDRISVLKTAQAHPGPFLVLLRLSRTPCLMGTTTIHERFNSKDADIVIESSDHVQFCLHRRHLEEYTGAFPGTEVDTQGRVVELTESAQVLELLFVFTKPQRYPDLEDQVFETLLALAEAVEKYEVYAAMYPCMAGLRRSIQEHPEDVLAHAVKHDYPNLADEAAYILIFSPPIRTAERLPGSYVLAWMRYHQSCQRHIFEAAEKILNAMRVVVPGRCYPYENPRQICRTCFFLVKAWLGILKQLSSRIELETALREHHFYPREIPHANCRDCKDSNRCLYLEEVARKCLERLGSIPSFSTFLYTGGDGKAVDV